MKHIYRAPIFVVKVGSPLWPRAVQGNQVKGFIPPFYKGKPVKAAGQDFFWGTSRSIFPPRKVLDILFHVKAISKALWFGLNTILMTFF